MMPSAAPRIESILRGAQVERVSRASVDFCRLCKSKLSAAHNRRSGASGNGEQGRLGVPLPRVGNAGGARCSAFSYALTSIPSLTDLATKRTCTAVARTSLGARAC
jgi:hypothetical protein